MELHRDTDDDQKLRNVVSLGEALQMPLVAKGDVHSVANFLFPYARHIRVPPSSSENRLPAGQVREHLIWVGSINSHRAH